MLLGHLYTVLDTLEGDFVTLCAGPREAKHHPTVLFSNLLQDLTSLDNKMMAVLQVCQHVVFHHVIQVLDEDLQLALGLPEQRPLSP